jgi:hypothetical protein
MRTTKPLTVGLILMLLLSAGTVFADVSPLSGLTAEWWQVVGSIPTPVNPGLDQTGADCMVGQRGPVWFLAGTFFNGATTRTCSVPEGEWLFFPVVNVVNYNSPNLCGQGSSESVDVLRSVIAPIIDAAADLSVKVDGQPVNNVVRVKSLAFAITVPADSVLNAQCIAEGLETLPAAVYSPAVDDGFYTLLSPLSKGKHTVHIQGQIPALGLTVDVTYNLTIVPVLLQ